MARASPHCAYSHFCCWCSTIWPEHLCTRHTVTSQYLCSVHTITLAAGVCMSISSLCILSPHSISALCILSPHSISALCILSPHSMSTLCILSPHSISALCILSPHSILLGQHLHTAHTAVSTQHILVLATTRPASLHRACCWLRCGQHFFTVPAVGYHVVSIFSRCLLLATMWSASFHSACCPHKGPLPALPASPAHKPHPAQSGQVLKKQVHLSHQQHNHVTTISSFYRVDDRVLSSFSIGFSVLLSLSGTTAMKQLASAFSTIFRYLSTVMSTRSLPTWPSSYLHTQQ